MKRIKITKSWVLLLLIIFLISIRYNWGVGTLAEGLDTIDNLSYNSENNDLTYYDNPEETAYSYDLDTDTWNDAAWIDQSNGNYHDDFIYSFEHILVGTVNITIENNWQAFNNNFQHRQTEW